MHDLQLNKVEGGLGAVKGLQLAGIAGGFRRNPARKDFALIVAPPCAKAAGVFTQSGFSAAPVTVSRQHLSKQAEGAGFRSLIINSGNANAATGSQGIKLAEESCVLVADAIGCSSEQVLVASTGVIGAKLTLDPFKKAIPQALHELSDGSGCNAAAGYAAAEAIITTDTHTKTAAYSFSYETAEGTTETVTVGGMAKGSGMIAPHMATMIAVLATDAKASQNSLQKLLKEVVDVSFNKVTIDSDTSTNDSAFLIATGAATSKEFTDTHPAYPAFIEALTHVCQDLSYQIAQDGEGATKVIVVDVLEAATDEQADEAARAIADSPLVKTAVAGHDANWGRIAMAIGKSGATFSPEEVSISIMDMEVFTSGVPVEFSEEEALKRFSERDEVHIVVDLKAGNACTRIWTCDLTHGYIEINGDYRT